MPNDFVQEALEIQFQISALIFWKFKLQFKVQNQIQEDLSIWYL